MASSPSTDRLFGLEVPVDNLFLKDLKRPSFDVGDEGDLDLESGDVGDGGEIGSSGNTANLSSIGDAKTLPEVPNIKDWKRQWN